MFSAYEAIGFEFLEADNGKVYVGNAFDMEIKHGKLLTLHALELCDFYNSLQEDKKQVVERKGVGL